MKEKKEYEEQREEEIKEHEQISEGEEVEDVGLGVEVEAESEEVSYRKPFLSRMLNRAGIRTGRLVDWLLDWLQVLVVAGALAGVTMTFVVVRMQVPTGSMEPTIQAGSSFFVDKISYLFGREPKPGDIIVFWHDEGERRQRYVKRLIAVGGQRVQIKDCMVYIDGKPLQSDEFNYPAHPNPKRRCYHQGGRMGEQEWTVPPRHYFVLGDNSDNSRDSRWWGFVKEEDFIGQPFLRVWPLSQFGFMNGYFGSTK
jgi:signal peptidase I